VKTIRPYWATVIEDREFRAWQEITIQSFIRALSKTTIILKTTEQTHIIAETSIKTAMTTIVTTEAGSEFPKAPSFQLREYSSDKIITLEDFKGKPVFLEFSSPYCLVCLPMIPKVEQLYKKYGDNIVFIIISYGDLGEVKEMYEVRPIILVDDGKVFARCGVISVSKFYILDRKHRIIWSGLGR